MDKRQIEQAFARAVADARTSQAPLDDSTVGDPVMWTQEVEGATCDLYATWFVGMLPGVFPGTQNICCECRVDIFPENSTAQYGSASKRFEQREQLAATPIGIDPFELAQRAYEAALVTCRRHPEFLALSEAHLLREGSASVASKPKHPL